ncbi:hypothetical protein AGMMS49982_22130 [Bacteroidia bacterium]|nr:hypothetical protein AGMMS49982_22130 [Bacteroidia bacterium]
MTKEEITNRAKDIRDNLKEKSQYCRYNEINTKLDVIPPFVGNDEIKLIIIGQDPTVQNSESRKNIKCTLNLDKSNSLRTYIEFICNKLQISVDDNVYATNVFKYFYSKPPAQTMCVLYEHLMDNLALLKEEIKQYQKAIIITLGEPVLKLLTTEKEEVKRYWGYNRINNETRCDKNKFQVCENNKLERNFYVLPHVDYKRKIFYKENICDYLNYIKESAKIH